LSTKTIHDFISGTNVDLPTLTIFLDSLDTDERVREVRSLTASEQALLFESVTGFHAVNLTDFVPEGTPLLQEVIHYGRNSLPTLRFFEKRFCMPETQPNELWGYNKHILKPLIGPGYFIVRQHSASEVMIDYTEIPPSKPASWPRVVPNSARLGRYVYDGLRDIMRGVSKHVTIGRATRQGQPVDSWFVLCRAEPQTGKHSTK
jgi:hypothetical protein